MRHRPPDIVTISNSTRILDPDLVTVYQTEQGAYLLI